MDKIKVLKTCSAVCAILGILALFFGQLSSNNGILNFSSSDSYLSYIFDFNYWMSTEIYLRLMFLIMPLSAILIWRKNKNHPIVVFALNIVLVMYYTFSSGLGFFEFSDLSSMSLGNILVRYSPIFISILSGILIVYYFITRNNNSIQNNPFV